MSVSLITAPPRTGRPIRPETVQRMIEERWGVTRCRAWVLRNAPGRIRLGREVVYDRDIIAEWLEETLTEGAV